jgi:ABC-type sugar transport system ATPase subunit
MSARGFSGRLGRSRTGHDPQVSAGDQTGAPAPGDQSAQTLLIARGIGKRFGATRALEDCDLEIRRGEVHALVGENGSGKSTLIKILSGVFTQDAGTIEWQGAAASFRRPRQAQLAGVATVFQETLIADELSIRDNIFAGTGGLIRRGHSRRDEASMAAKILDDLGFGEASMDRPLWRLPLSQRQIVTIARALVRPWQLLILDEPTSALDVKEREGLFRFIRSVRDQGSAAVLLVSHRMDEITELADRATVLRNGRSVGSLPRAEISSAVLVRLMSDINTETADKAGSAQRVERAAARAGDTMRERRMVADSVVLRTAAQPFSLSVDDGEVVGVAGLAGHGQEDFLEAVAGLRRPQSGSILVRDGDALAAVRRFGEAFRLGVAYVPRDRKQEGLFMPLSVLDNMALPVLPRYSRAGVLQRKKLGNEAMRLLESLQLRGGRLDTPVARLSGGNQQKVLLGRWLAAEPRLLVLNDPMRGVDLGVKRQFYELLRRLSDEGLAVLLLSTELEELVAVAHRIVVFHEHTVSAVVPGNADSRASILAAMFGRSGSDG